MLNKIRTLGIPDGEFLLLSVIRLTVPLRYQHLTFLIQGD